MAEPTIFRANSTRALRGTLCAALALGLAWAIEAELTAAHIEPATRWGWFAGTALLELIMLGGLQRLWVVCLIVEDRGVIVRNFRGDIRLRRSQIKDVIRRGDYSGFHVALRLKPGHELGFEGDDLGLDGVGWTTPRRTDRAVAEIREALGLVPAQDQPERV